MSDSNWAALGEVSAHDISVAEFYANSMNPSRREFAQAVLAEIGADPYNENALNVLGSWMQRENGNGSGTGSGFNPLNVALTTQEEVNAGFWNDLHNEADGWKVRGATTTYGVRNFRSMKQGVTWTANTLLNSYPSVVEALKEADVTVEDERITQVLGRWSGDGYESLANYPPNLDWGVGIYDGNTDGSPPPYEGLDLSSIESSVPDYRQGVEPQVLNEVSEADELYAEHGGFGWFLNSESEGLLIGVDNRGQAVDVNDPSSVRSMHILDYITNEGIVGAENIEYVLRNTQWYKDNNALQRDFDVTWAKLADVDRLYILEDTVNNLKDLGEFRGYEISEENLYNMAYSLHRLGRQNDDEYLKKFVSWEIRSLEMSDELVEFDALVDEKIRTAEDDYYVNISDEEANRWAEMIWTGEQSEEEFNQWLMRRTLTDFPHLREPLELGGYTPKEWFANIELSIENILGRPINLREEGLPVIQFVDDTGSVRAMTTPEAQNWARSQPEYLNSQAARSKVFAFANTVAETFGGKGRTRYYG